VTNVRFANLTFGEGASMQDGILVDAHYRAANPSCPTGWKPAAPPRMANYTFEHIDGVHVVRGGSPFHFLGPDGSTVTSVLVRNVHLPPAAQPFSNWSCANVAGAAVQGTVDPWPPCSGFTKVLDHR
jgi:hypothetical protein